MYGGADAQIREMLRDVASMANAEGGAIVIGMDEDGDGRAAGLVPVADAETQANRLVSSCLAEFYVDDLERRGKGADTIGRAASTARAMERLMPALLAAPVSRVHGRDVYDFRQALAREGKVASVEVAGERVERGVPAKPSSINRDLRTL